MVITAGDMQILTAYFAPADVSRSHFFPPSAFFFRVSVGGAHAYLLMITFYYFDYQFFA